MQVLGSILPFSSFSFSVQDQSYTLKIKYNKTRKINLFSLFSSFFSSFLFFFLFFLFCLSLYCSLLFLSFLSPLGRNIRDHPSYFIALVVLLTKQNRSSSLLLLLPSFLLLLSLEAKQDWYLGWLGHLLPSLSLLGRLAVGELPFSVFFLWRRWMLGLSRKLWFIVVWLGRTISDGGCALVKWSLGAGV